MDTILYALLVSVVFITLFAKPANEDAKDRRLVEMYCGTEPAKEDPVAKPKRGRKPKKSEDLGDFALEVATKKKLGRKKKQS